MSSKILVDEIAPKTTGGSITSTGLIPTGSVIQTVFTTPALNGLANVADSYMSTSSSTFYDASGNGHYVEITPTSSSSKILVSASFPGYSNGSGYYIFKRSINGGAYEDLTEYNSSLVTESMGLLASSSWQTMNFFWLDTPNTTSTVKYGIFLKTGGSGSVYIGWGNANIRHNGCKYLAQEIAG